MEKKKWSAKRVVTIQIEQYLAEYIIAKYRKDTTSGGIKIPSTTDLYFCVWENMTKQRSNQPDVVNGNLRIHLPQRKAGVIASPWKDPAYYNYLSPAAAKEIEAQIRRMFNFELHRILLENEEFGRQKSTSTSAIIIDYDKFVESYNIDFRRDYADDSNKESKPVETKVTNTTGEPPKKTLPQELPFEPSDGSDEPF